MNYLPEFSDLTSHTSAGETHFPTSIWVHGTPSARKTAVPSPWSACTRQIMELPFNEAYPCPSKDARIVACHIVELAYQLSAHLSLNSNRPLITSNDEGEIVLEWWHLARKMTVYVEATQISFVRVWGADIAQQMDDGTLQDARHFLQIWRWLHG